MSGPDPRELPSVNKHQGRRALLVMKNRGEQLLARRPVTHEALTVWSNGTADHIKATFGSDSSHLATFKRVIDRLKPLSDFKPEKDLEPDRAKALQKQLALLEGLVQQLETDITLEAPVAGSTNLHEQPGSGGGGGGPMPDPRKVFVVHGRDESLRRDFFSFLRALQLEPLEWSQAIQLTGKGSPYVGEILDAALGHAQAIVALLSPDDEVRLTPELWNPDEGPLERDVHLQARPNVLFEAGMAFGRSPHRTVLVKVGQTKPFSDIDGRHVVRLTDEALRRNDLANRLRTAGCDLSTDGQDWLREGHFTVTRTPGAAPENDRSSTDATRPSAESERVKYVDPNYPADSGMQRMLEEQGYRLAWRSDDRLARALDVEGWELARATDGSVLKFKDRPSDQTLVMKKRDPTGA